MKKYFLYLLKKNLLPLACFTLFCVILYVLPILVENYSYWNNYRPGLEDYYYYYSPTLYCGNISLALGLLSVFIPIGLFSYKMNRRSVDMCYSLPLGRTKILAANFLVGLILLYVPYTLAYLWGFAAIAIKVERIYLIYYLYLYLASLIPAFILYALTAFIYTRANTVVDGVVSLIGAICLLVALMGAVDQILWPYNWYPGIYNSEAFFPFMPLSEVSTSFTHAIRYGSVDPWFTESKLSYQYQSGLCTLISGMIWLCAAVAATFGLILSEKHSKAENCGQISESIFSYKVLIPVYAVLLTALVWAGEGGIASLAAIVFGIFVLSVIYKRSIKIGWKFAFTLVACVVGGLLLVMLPNVIITSLTA